MKQPSGREGRTSTLFNSSKNLATSSQKLRPDSEPQHSSIPVPRFQSRGGVFDDTGGTYSHGGMIDYPRFPISEMHLGRFPDSGISKLESQLQD